MLGLNKCKCKPTGLEVLEKEPNPSGLEVLNTKIKLSETLGKEVDYTIVAYSPDNVPENYFQTLMEVANDGFGTDMSIDDVKNHIYKSNKIFLLKINGEIVGFSSMKELNNFIYRFGTVIKKKFQGSGLYRILNEKLSEILGDKLYFLRTQNQNVIKSLQKSFDNVIYGKKALDFMKAEGLSISELNEFFMSCGDEKGTLNEDGIFEGVYGRKLLGEGIETIEGIDAENGDAILIVYFK